MLVHPSAASIWSCEIAYFLLIELNGCHIAGVDTLVTCGSRGCLIDIGQSPPDLHFNPAIDGRKQQNYLITKFIFQFIKVFGLLSLSGFEHPSTLQFSSPVCSHFLLSTNLFPEINKLSPTR